MLSGPFSPSCRMSSAIPSSVYSAFVTLVQAVSTNCVTVVCPNKSVQKCGNVLLSRLPSLDFGASVQLQPIHMWSTFILQLSRALNSNLIAEKSSVTSKHMVPTRRPFSVRRPWHSLLPPLSASMHTFGVGSPELGAELPEVGLRLGFPVFVGPELGAVVGKLVGPDVGSWVGNTVGAVVGPTLGLALGKRVCMVDGEALGAILGVPLGQLQFTRIPNQLN